MSQERAWRSWSETDNCWRTALNDHFITSNCHGKENTWIKYFYLCTIKPEKTANILQRQHWFRCKKKSEEGVQKFWRRRVFCLSSDDESLPRPGQSLWLDEANFPCCTTNQKHYPDLGSNTPSVWKFCARSPAVISQGNQWWHRKLSAVFLG